MSIKDSSISTRREQERMINGPPRRENVPPRPFPRPGPPAHRPSNSEEERRRLAKQRGELDIFADPPTNRSRERRPRRNSESSVRDRKVLDPEEEKKRREKRETRYKDGKRSGSTSKSGKPNRRLDVIDKLDVTSIYGTGRKLFCGIS